MTKRIENAYKLLSIICKKVPASIPIERLLFMGISALVIESLMKDGNSG